MLYKKTEARRKNDRPPEYLFYKLIGTRLSSHDLLNLEYCHHQKFAVLIMSFIGYINFSGAKVVRFAGTAKFLFAFFQKKLSICKKTGPFTRTKLQSHTDCCLTVGWVVLKCTGGTAVAPGCQRRHTRVWERWHPGLTGIHTRV